MAVCGTGLGNLPQPGDPNLDSPILSTSQGEGGIYVSWTYPSVNPEAVAYTLLYRNTVNNFGTASPSKVVTGTQYFDWSDVVVGTVYYYWIQMVSVHATVGATIGPASATMLPPIEQVVALLEGQVRDSELNAALKSRIDQIDGFATGLADETADRLAAEAALSATLSGTQTSLTNLDTTVNSEIATRITNEAAILVQVDSIAVSAGNNSAAIVTESNLRATADSALSNQITTVTATVGDHTASIEILDEVVITADGALASTRYVKIDNDGYVAGFGLYNTGVTSQFIVRSDLFSVGLAGETTKPIFTIGLVSGVSQIVLNAATFIADATISNLMVGDIYSTTWNPTTKQGWYIDKNGNISASSIVIYDGAGGVIMNSGGLGGAQGTKLAGIDDEATRGAIGLIPADIRGPEGHSDIQMVMNTDLGGANAGEILMNAGSYILPDGTVRTLSTNRDIDTLYEGSVVPPDGVFFIVWGASDASSRFPTVTLTGTSEADGVFPARYDRDARQWYAVGNTAAEATFTPLVTDYVIAVGYKVATSGGIEMLTQVVPSFEQMNSSNITTYIADLAVDTLQIAGNAVTVPDSDDYTTPAIIGDNAWHYNLCEVAITISAAAELLLWWSFRQGWTSGSSIWGVRIYDVDAASYILDRAGMVSHVDFPSGVLSRTASGAGTYTFRLSWFGGDNDVTMQTAHLVVQGAMK